MSGGGKESGGWDGTSGSPQGKLENGDYERGSNHDLTPAQAKAVKKAENNINDHLNDKHLEAAERDIEGKPITRKDGKVYDHLDETSKALRGLKRSQKSISDSLKNPNLSPGTRSKLEKELSKIDYYFKKWSKIKK